MFVRHIEYLHPCTVQRRAIVSKFGRDCTYKCVSKFGSDCTYKCIYKFRNQSKSKKVDLG